MSIERETHQLAKDISLENAIELQMLFGKHVVEATPVVDEGENK